MHWKSVLIVDLCVNSGTLSYFFETNEVFLKRGTIDIKSFLRNEKIPKTEERIPIIVQKSIHQI